MVIYVDDGTGLGSGLPVDPGYGVPAPGARPGHDLPGRPPGGGPGVDNTLPPIPTAPSPGRVRCRCRFCRRAPFLVVWAPGQGWVAVPVDPNAPGVDNTLPWRRDLISLPRAPRPSLSSAPGG
jgi:hypothetical protein